MNSAFDTGVLVASGDVAIQMKTPLGFSYVGFADEQLGQRYLAAMGIDAKQFSFEKLSLVLPSWPEEKKKTDTAVFFRTVEDVARFVDDRESFPYANFRIPLHALETGG